MAEVYVGLGSNIDAERNIVHACAALREHFGPLRLSSVFRSAAVGFEGADFLNMVAGFASDAGPDAVEAVLSAVERAAGRRRRGVAAGSRTLDLDLLLYGAMVDAERRLPRNDVLGYAFVLAPLAQLAPGLRHPVGGRTMESAWRARAGAVLLDLGPVDGLSAHR